MVEEWELNCYQAQAEALDAQRRRDPLAVAHHDAQERDTNRDGLIERNRQTVKSLRLMADWLEQHPEFPTRPIDPMTAYSFDIQLAGESKASAFARLAAMLGTADKRMESSSVEVVKSFGQIGILVYASRGDICERVVHTEHKIVTEPDPAALKAVPMVTYEKDVEVVEWKCPPSLLALQEVA